MSPRQRSHVDRVAGPHPPRTGPGAVAPAAPAAAQAQPRPVHPDGPSHFAITGARIVTVSGSVIDKGTVVVNNGLIEAVGPNVRVPAGAWVIDGSGKTVYPGLIDAFTTLGHPYTAPQRSFGGPGGGGGRGGAQASQEDYSWGPEDRPGTQSWISAADDIDAGDARLERWRDAGFTTVVSTLQPTAGARAGGGPRPGALRAAP